MADVTARFSADFSSFVTAVNRAETELRSFESGAADVQRALNRIGNSLSGRGVIQQATLMAKAVEDIGGAAKLTDAELSRVNRTVTEAIAKMERLGMAVPDNLRKLAADSKVATAEVGGLSSTLGTLSGALGALGIGVGIGSLVSFGQAILADADALTKLAARTDLSLQALQRFQVVGDDVGNSVEEMTSAIASMQNRIAGGDASAEKAIRQMGYSLQEFKALGPEQQFYAVSDAVRAIKDPADQAAFAIDVFGKSGSQILPALKAGFDDVRDSAVGMSDDAIEAIDALGDTWGSFSRTAKGTAAELVVEFARFAQAGFSPFQKQFDDQVRLMQQLQQQVQQMAGATGKPAIFAPPPSEFKASESALKAFNREMDAAAKKAEQVAAAQKKAAAEAKALRDRWAAVEEAAQGVEAVLGSINGEVEQAIRYYVRQGVALQDVAELYGLTKAQTQALATQLKTEADAWKATEAAVRRYMATRGNSTQLVDILPSSGQAVRDYSREVELLGERSRTLARYNGDVAGTVQGVAQAFGILAQVGGDSFSGMERSVGQIVAQMNAIQQAAQSFGASISNTSALLVSIGLNVIQMLAAAQSRDDMRMAAITATSMQAVAQYAEDASRYMGAYGRELLDAIGKSKSLEEAQQRVAQLAKEIEERRRIANAAESRYGMGREALDRQVKDAKAILDYMETAGRTNKQTGEFIRDFTDEQIARAYYDWQVAMAKAGDEAAAAWVKAHDSAQEAGTVSNKVLDDLLNRRKSLADSIANEAPEEVMGVIEAQTRGQIAALDKEIEAQRVQLEQQAQQAADAVETAIANIDPPPVTVKVQWDVPPLPGGGLLDVTPMAAGGSGIVTQPTLFLAGEAGPEEFAFSGANRRFAGASAMAGGDLMAELAALRQQQASQTAYLQAQFPRDLARAVRDAVLVAS